ncbi:hypothetical protein LOZ80_01405 [Paenibacillus sp. HWE-109]|uniref:hypothetical protein n=1 Tax=Paenibacillus sp. HWE-109 TaxID=1306526 RepID=UPI001EE14C62|nr:hypothetical protein [Paenibacillus sp. HWE-109]UKS27634.1 hypothetical protein LOZ80_01405 [Paenibacillus sp. HWE-109]
MFQVVDFGRSVPYSFSSSVIQPILSTPSSITLAQFGVQVQPAGQVMLNATVGTQTTLGAPQVLFSIIRGNIIVYTITVGSLPQDQFNGVSFSFVDIDAPSGYLSYTLTAEIMNNVISNRANVVGPVVFSGLSLARV